MKSTQKVPKTRLIREFYNDPDRKSLARIIGELLFLSVVKHKLFPRYYFSRYLFKKDRTNILDYFPSEFFEKVNRFFNDDNARGVMENKLFFNLFYSQFNVPLPRILAFNHRNKFVSDGIITEINDPVTFRSYMKHLAKKMHQNDSLFIKRIWGTWGGDQVYKVFNYQIEDTAYDLSGLFKIVTDSEFLIQEKIKQHPALNEFNPASVNSIRIDTFIDKQGTARVMNAYLRTSIKGLHVDNISSGGCQIPIDLTTGKLLKYGHFTIVNHGVTEPDEHPWTHIRFEGFKIPFFEAVKTLVCTTASYMPNLRMVGWDVAIGESGPVIIEANSNYEIAGCDLAYGGYRRNPVFRKALEEMGVL